MTTQRLTQAYRQTPWRTQLQWIGLFLLTLIILATVAGIYLSVSAGAAAVGREIQQLEYDREQIAREIADKRTLLAQLTSTSQMSKRATELGYEAIQAGSVQYMVIPGYIPRQPVSLVITSAYTAYQPSLVEPRFTQSLLEWITEQFVPYQVNQ
jgi:cell division protein FtsL